MREPLIKSGLNFPGDKMFRFKAQIAENSLLFSIFATQMRDVFALKNIHNLFRGSLGRPLKKRPPENSGAAFFDLDLVLLQINLIKSIRD